MKKFIYVAAALSLAACTSEEIMEVDVPSGKIQKGITFEMGMPESDVLTRGALTQQRNFFWFAETDRVNIYFTGDGAEPKDGMSPAPYQYKATKSEANAYLTAVDDANMLVFNGNGSANFAGLYGATNEVVTTNGANNIISIKFNVDDNTGQTVKMNEVIAPMYGISNNVTRNQDWESVGEKAQLQFERPFPVLKMSLSGTDEGNKKYLDVLGNLKSIKVENKTTPTGGYTLSQPKLAATSATYDTKDGKMEIISGDANSVTATIADGGAKWNVEDAVNISILPVLAKEYKGVETQNKNLKFEISWEFAKTTITKTIEQKTATDINTPHAIYDICPLDLATEARYFVTNDKKLYIFDPCETKLRQMIKEDKIHGVDIDQITSIYSEVAFDDDDQNKLAGFTALTTLELVSEDQTSLSKPLPASLTTVNLPYVTKVANTLVFDGTGLVSVSMPAFDFAVNKTLTESILKAGSLEKLDMSGVSSMKEAYPKDGMTLQGFDQLTTVTNKAGLELGPESFKGCTSLTSLSSYVKLGGYAAFQGCSMLVEVAISSKTKIFDSTFKGATLLTTVRDETGQSIQPKEIGQYAFAGTMTNIDLSQTTSIGASAFENVITLKGTQDVSRGGIWSIDVNAETIGEYAFKGCMGLQYVKFKNLTLVPSGLLNGCKLTELKFAKVVGFDENTKAGALGNLLENCKLFVNPDQKYSNNVLYGYYNEGTKKYVEYAFKTIVEE